VDIISVSQCFMIINCYRRPAVDNDAAAICYCRLLTECISSLCTNKVNPVVLGDFNFGHIDWSNIDFTALDGGDTNCTSLFVKLVSSLGFHQFVTEPTRFSNNSSAILDLILGTDPFAIVNVHTDVPFCTSDHNIVQFSLLVPGIELSNYCNPECFDFNRADWDAINDCLSNVNWDIVLDRDITCDECFVNFYSILYSCIKQFVPRSSGKRVGSIDILNTLMHCCPESVQFGVSTVALVLQNC